MSEYKHWAFSNSGLSFAQLHHNTIFPGRKTELWGMTIAVRPEGICINGDCGVNPNVEEMREMVDIMRECVRLWDEMQNHE